MGRRKKGRPVHGWLVLDKPAGITSARAVSRVRALLCAAKAGHGGTLDPLATGVLPIALGEATKAVAYIMGASKTYRFTLRWGEERTTDDAEGEIVQVSDTRPTHDQIRAALPDFTGPIVQTPPRFSAVKIEGRRAYELARHGEAAPLKPRPVEVFRFDLVSSSGPEDENSSDFEIECGKGTYIRAIARDLGRQLGAFGHVAALRRTCVGPFTEDRAISLDKLDELVHSPPPNGFILPVETALADIPALAVTGGEAKRLRCGQSLRVPSRKQGTVCVMAEGRPVALAELDKGTLRPFRVFNL